MQNKRRNYIAVILTLIIILSAGMPVYAAISSQRDGKPVTIKVAFYPLDGFFEYDSEGNESGYGVDYLNELKNYANIEWEYVPVDSWEKIGPMLQAGEVDVRMPVSEPVTPSVKYNYTTNSILPTYHAIMTLKSRTDLYYDDYDEFINMKFAASSSLLARTGLDDYFESIGIINNLVFFDDYNSCRAALDSGAVDGVISNVMDLTDDMKILDKFAVTKNYITTVKDSPYYTIINNAMRELELENPSFSTNLYEKYYPEHTVEPYTKDEINYINNAETLKVAVYSNREPVCYYDEKEKRFKGIAIDLAEKLSSNIGIDFEYVAITTDNPRDMLSEADLVMPVTKALADDNYFVTHSLLDSEIVMSVKAGSEQLEDDATVGILSSTEGIRSLVEKKEKYNIVLYDSNADALKALQNGQIEAFINSSYVINWLLDNPRYDNLSVLRYRSIPIEYSICGDTREQILCSILNKGISRITEEEQKDIIKNYTSFSMSDLTALDKLYIYRVEINYACAVIIISVVAIILYTKSRTRYIREIEKKSREQRIANMAKSNFLSRMSHDLRTPMNAIIGMSYLGLNSQSLDETKDYHKKINESGKYLLGLINDTLDMSKMDSDKMELHLEHFWTKDFADAINVLFAEKAEDKGVDFSIEYDETIKHGILVDKLRLQQIFVNLINNAIKFSYKGGTVQFIIKEDEVVDGKVDMTFIVKDSGCGMTKEFQAKMYEPFEQGEHSDVDTETGTGLGLSIVKRLVELMKGTIECDSEVGRGTTFTIKLNAEVCDAKTASSNNELAITDTDREMPILRGKRVLLCEDHPLNTMIAVKLLEKAGIIVETAENGQIGLEKFAKSEENYYDIILMDIRMPVMDGLEATKAIRKMNRKDSKVIPIIAMTANAFDDDKVKSLEAGMNEHLAKPIDAKLLYNTLERYVKVE